MPDSRPQAATSAAVGTQQARPARPRVEGMPLEHFQPGTLIVSPAKQDAMKEQHPTVFQAASGQPPSSRLSHVSGASTIIIAPDNGESSFTSASTSAHHDPPQHGAPHQKEELQGAPSSIPSVSTQNGHAWRGTQMEPSFHEGSSSNRTTSAPEHSFRTDSRTSVGLG